MSRSLPLLAVSIQEPTRANGVAARLPQFGTCAAEPILESRTEDGTAAAPPVPCAAQSGKQQRHSFPNRGELPGSAAGRDERRIGPVELGKVALQLLELRQVVKDDV